MPLPGRVADRDWGEKPQWTRRMRARNLTVSKGDNLTKWQIRRLTFESLSAGGTAAVARVVGERAPAVVVVVEGGDEGRKQEQQATGPKAERPGEAAEAMDGGRREATSRPTQTAAQSGGAIDSPPGPSRPGNCYSRHDAATGRASERQSAMDGATRRNQRDHATSLENGTERPYLAFRALWARNTDAPALYRW